MAKADYQLRHQLFGQQGSLWERQVTPEARTQIRRIVKEGGQASILAEIDQIAAGVLNENKVLVEDEFFRFSDGDLAVVGQHQRDYAHTETTLADGRRLHIAYRNPPAESSDDPLPTRIARVTAAFLADVDRDEATLPTDRDWYLVPAPEGLTPLVIEGRGDDVYLVNGIDFIARDGYIIFTDDPAQVLPVGMVRVSSAYKQVFSPNSFVLSAPVGRRGTRYLAEYAYKSQALETFKRAAAEYAGLYVFQKPDVVLGSTQLGVYHWVYSMANAGAVEIRYEHELLTVGQKVEPGYIVTNGFEVFSNTYNEGEGLQAQFVGSGWTEPLSLNGILPIKGLTWDGGPLFFDAPESGPAPDFTPHVRLQFSGEAGDQAAYWDWQKKHELQTKNYLYSSMTAGETVAGQIDFWYWLWRFYGTQILVVLFDNHTPTINSRLHQFVFEHHPKSCNVLFSAITLPPYTVLTSPEGAPLVDESGEYVAASLSPPCEDFVLSIDGNLLAHDGNVLAIEVCDVVE